MHSTGGPQSPSDMQAGLELAHRLVASGEPLAALKVVADLLRAAGLEREADESVSKVVQALAVGSTSAGAADELAGLLSLISLQQQSPQQLSPAQAPGGFPSQQQQQQQSSFGGNSGSNGPAGMDIEGGTGPGPPINALMAAATRPDDLGMLVAQAEGASYVCQLCGGVVSVARQAAHQQLWCPVLQQQQQQQQQPNGLL